jgi:hypothetical protein
MIWSILHNNTKVIAGHCPAVQLPQLRWRVPIARADFNTPLELLRRLVCLTASGNFWGSGVVPVPIDL